MNHDLLSWILTQVEDEVVILDRDGIILFTNRAWQGYDRKDAIGLPLERLLAPEFHEGHRRRMERIFETGEPDEFEVNLERPDGQPVWYRGRLVPVIRDGEAPLAVGISRNVTAERHGKEATKLLETLVPLCAWCRRVGTDDGDWEELEEYLESAGGSSVTHSLCPSCEKKMLKGGPRAG